MTGPGLEEEIEEKYTGQVHVDLNTPVGQKLEVSLANPFQHKVQTC